MREVLSFFQFGMLEEANKEKEIKWARWWLKTLFMPGSNDCLTDRQCKRITEQLKEKAQDELTVGERALLQGIKTIRRGEF